MAPTHDPTKEPKGDNPYIFVDDHGVTWSWDFIKSLWFEFNVDPLKVEDQNNVGEKRVFVDEEIVSQEPPAKKKKEKPVIDTRPASIYVEGLPSDTTLEEVLEFFSRSGIIKRDEYTGDYKIKLYKEEDGSLKGDALITYFKPESVELALTVLDGADYRYKCPIKVTKAQFEPTKLTRKEKKRKKAQARGRNAKIRFDQTKELSWDEESRVHVVLKGLFEPKDGWTDINFASDLKEDVKEECEKFGEVELIAVFENNPEGVVTVKFKEPLAAARCIEVMNGRFFAKRQISAEYYDGFTNYKCEESEEQRKLRAAAWEKFIEGEDSD